MNPTSAHKYNILTALWNVLSAANLSENILIDNRKSASKLDSFVVIGINGRIRNMVGHSRCDCFVQLFARDVDTVGTPGMTKISELSEGLLQALPKDTQSGVYTFNLGDEIGKRDLLGFHSVIFNVSCLIN
jgi:hypothetical protein